VSRHFKSVIEPELSGRNDRCCQIGPSTGSGTGTRGGFGLAALLQPHLKSTYRAGRRHPWLHPSRSVRHRCWSYNGPLYDPACRSLTARPRAVGSPCLYITQHYANRPLYKGFTGCRLLKWLYSLQCRCPSRNIKDNSLTANLYNTLFMGCSKYAY
jgi:hypothetical protein